MFVVLSTSPNNFNYNQQTKQPTTLEQTRNMTTRTWVQVLKHGLSKGFRNPKMEAERANYTSNGKQRKERLGAWQNLEDSREDTRGTREHARKGKSKTI